MNYPQADPRRLLVVLPNWVGDVVLATPVLAALRTRFADAQIGFLLRRYVSEIVAGCGWHDFEEYWPAQRGPRSVAAQVGLARRLARREFEAALLLTNSFRSALVVRLAGVPRRIGYSREARGWLLSERLRPLRKQGEFVPTPMLGYYAALAERLGCPIADTRLRLGITAEQEAAAQRLKRHYGLRDKAYAVVNSGAAFGASKCWLPERFAEVCDRLSREHGLTPVLVGAPGEAPLMRMIAERASAPVVTCIDPGTTLGSLKGLVRDAALLVCNDTGPRHYGNAFGVPTLTIFGPTHQEWTDTGYAGEVKLQVAVECGPCQLPRCPLDHRCMTRVTSELVMQNVARLIGADAG
jgi:heptosyltransferase-2